MRYRIMKKGNTYAVQQKLPFLPIWVGYYNILCPKYAEGTLQFLLDTPQLIKEVNTGSLRESGG